MKIMRIMIMSVLIIVLILPVGAQKENSIANYIKGVKNTPAKWFGKQVRFSVKMLEYVTVDDYIKVSKTFRSMPPVPEGHYFDRLIVKGWTMTNTCCGLSAYYLIKKNKEAEEIIDEILGSDQEIYVSGTIIGCYDLLGDKFPIIDVVRLDDNKPVR